MKAYCSGLKEKMLELTRLFCIERNVFQKFVIVYKYITLIDKDPITQGILQKIFDDTAKVMGEAGQNLNEDRFLNVKNEAIHTNEFWVYYSNLKVIHSRMKKIKECRFYEKAEFEDLCLLFSKPYSKEALKLSFKVVNSNIFDHLDQDSFLEDEDDDKKTWFDEKKSFLYIKGSKIAIAKQNKETNAHKILKYIFITNKDNLDDSFFYSEIATDEFGDTEYKADRNSWRKYFYACEEIQSKIGKATKNDVDNFLIFNTGQKGSIKLNSEHL